MLGTLGMAIAFQTFTSSLVSTQSRIGGLSLNPRRNIVTQQTFRPQHSRISKASEKTAVSATLAMTDFDSIREFMRSLISFTSTSLSVLTLSLLVSKAVRKSESAAMSFDSLGNWLTKRSPAEFQKLSICLALDVIGFAPELILAGPLGEYLDVVWAPLYAFVIYSMFGSRPLIYRITLATGGFLEEILPYTDFIPSATIGWVLEVRRPSLHGKPPRP